MKLDRGGHQLDEPDVIAYQQALESMHGVGVVVQLQVAARGSKGAWAVIAHSFEEVEGKQKLLLSSDVRTYPSMHHKTFAGAVLAALFDLEERLCANWAIQSLGEPQKSA